jgi:hypothetical protein
MKVDMGLRLHHTLLGSFDIVGQFMLDRHLRRDAFISVPHPRVVLARSLLFFPEMKDCGGERTQVNAITMEERMKKEKRKMQMERREEVKEEEERKEDSGR